MIETHQLYIDGRWRDAATRAVIDVVNPATEQVASTVAAAAASDVDEALASAVRMFPVWSRGDVGQRAEMLRRAAARLGERLEPAARVLTREQGKPLAESRAEIRRAIETLAWHADAAPAILAHRLHEQASVQPEPLGVAAAFVPWNYPCVIAARKLAAALSAGCPVILKGPEEAPGIIVELVCALEEAGLPAGAVQLLFGDPPGVAERLLSHAAVRVLSFTGSTQVGRQLAARAAASLTRCVLELGGHAPVILCADADVVRAAEAISAYKYECAGQSCNAPSRVYVHEAVQEAFLAHMTRIARALRVGDGEAADTGMGPLMHARRLDAVARLTEDARARGACLLTGGERLPRRGFFWPPTLMVDVPDQAQVMQEEAFGPLLPVALFAHLDDVMARANANPYGLAAYVFTSNEQTAQNLARGLEAGSVGINSLAGVPPHVGIAGIKDSGYGYEGGQGGVEAFLNLKVVRHG